MICSTLQAVLLIQFNHTCPDGTSSSDGGHVLPRALSLEELIRRLHLEEILVKKLLGSLMLGKFKILQKVMQQKTVVARTFLSLICDLITVEYNVRPPTGSKRHFRSESKFFLRP